MIKISPNTLILLKRFNKFSILGLACLVLLFTLFKSNLFSNQINSAKAADIFVSETTPQGGSDIFVGDDGSSGGSDIFAGDTTPQGGGSDIFVADTTPTSGGSDIFIADTTPTYSAPVMGSPIYNPPTFRGARSQDVYYPPVPQTTTYYQPPQQITYMPQPQPIIVSPDINNSSNSSSNSSSSSSSSSRASVDNDIRINNQNVQTQSQQIVFTPTAVSNHPKVITREIIREVPVTRTTEVVRYEAQRPTTQYVTTQPQQVVYAGQPVVYQQPQVVTVAGDSQVKELPKTGAPLAALALAGLLPAGLKLRKFAKQNKDINPNYIWEERELSRN